MAAGRARQISGNVSPRQVADALGVSESSVKRWSDQGLMATAKTAGGHRKLVLADVLRFVREQGYDIGKPESLGLPARLPRAIEEAETRAQLVAALVDGDAETARRLVIGMFVRGVPLVELFDRVLGPAVRELGDRWEHGSVRVFEEHRAIVVVQRTLQDLRGLIARRAGRRPIALLATLSGDPYTVAVTMAELTLIELGWAATNLGPDTPAFSVIEAIAEIRPRVLGIGINAVLDLDAFATAYAAITDAARTHRTAVVVGGPALTTELRARIHYAACCAGMRELGDFCTSL